MIRQIGTLLGFLGIVGFFSLQRPETFMTLPNWLNILEQMSILGVVAFASTVVMVVGDFDLSVGSMASLAGIIAAFMIDNGQPLPVALALALGAGLLGGLFNGFIVSYIQITPFVATLGTLTMYAGLALLVSDGTTIFGRAIGEAFGGFAGNGIPVGTVNERVQVLSNLTLLSGGVFGVIWLVLEQTVFGRRLYAIGGNTEAARLSGIRVRVLRLLAFVFSGLGAAIAGIMLVSRLETANPTQGSGLMLQAIAAVFLGMTMSEEGEPHVAGTLLGVLILGVLANGLRLMAVDSYVQQVLTGGIIILAVTLSSLSRRD